MTNTEYRNLYVKTLYVIASCKTEEHLVVASKYLDLAAKKLGTPHKDTLLSQALIKEYEINGR